MKIKTITQKGMAAILFLFATSVLANEPPKSCPSNDIVVQTAQKFDTAVKDKQLKNVYNVYTSTSLQFLDRYWGVAIYPVHANNEQEAISIAKSLAPSAKLITPAPKALPSGGYYCQYKAKDSNIFVATPSNNVTPSNIAGTH